MRLALTQFLSLDGVSQGPGSPDEDTSDGFTQGGWFVPHMDETFVQLAADWFAEADPNDPFTAKMNSVQKYVASQSLKEATWAPTTILSGDIAAHIAALKSQPGRETQIHGSAQLAQSLLAAGLIDTLRLVIAPVVVGNGRRLFPVGGAPAGLQLLSTATTPGGLVIHTYETTGLPQYGTYGVGA